MLQEPVLPLLRRLPTAWTQDWLPYDKNTLTRALLTKFNRLSLFGRIWHAGHEPFAKAGSDTILVVSSSGNVLWTCDAEATMQFSKQHHDYVKPVNMMGMLNMYGPTITATEGEENRLYRRITAPTFNESTHSLAWNESLKQATAMLKFWVRTQGPAKQVKEDTAKLTLHVISHVCFDRDLEWEETAGQEEKIPAGHTMSYREAISSMLESTGTLFVTPPPVLSKLIQIPT